MTHAEIINEILSATNEKGRQLVRKLEHIEALIMLRDFDPNKDWIEQKDLTKAGKLLGGILLKVYPELLPQNNPLYKGYGIFAHDFTPADLKIAYDRVVSRVYYDSDQEREDSRQIFQIAVKKAEDLWPVADHYNAIKKGSCETDGCQRKKQIAAAKSRSKGSLTRN